MSFGWSASDIASLVKLAYKTTQGARAACGEYDELTRETSSLHTILNRLSLEVAKPDSSINRQRSYRRELESIGTGCQEVLAQLDKILVKYNALSEQERSARRLWKKIRFGSGVVADVAELRSRVTYYISALSLFLNLVSVGTVGAVEKKMDQAGGDLRDIKTAVNKITAQFLSTERREGSVLTTYTNDDKDAWRELRRGLVKAGFRDSLVRTHMDTIMAYVKEIGDRGVLDDVDIDGADSPTGPARVSKDLEESSRERQNSRQLFTARSSVTEDGPIKKKHEGRQVSPEGKTRSAPTAKLDIRGKVSSTPEAHSNFQSSQDPTEGSSHVSLAAQDYQSKEVDDQTSQSTSQPGKQHVQDQELIGMTDFLKHQNLRYYSWKTLCPTPEANLISLDDVELPRFVARRTVIYRISDGSELYKLLRCIQPRVLALMDPCGYFALGNQAQKSKRMKSRYSMMQQAVSLLLCFRFPNVAGVIDNDSIDSLDFRRVTTLCSVFAAEFLYGLVKHVPDSVIDQQVKKLRNWQAEFDKSLPNNNEQLHQHYGTSLLYHLTQQPGVAVSVRNAKRDLPVPKVPRWYHYPRLFADVTQYPPWLPPAAWETPRLRSERTPNG